MQGIDVERLRLRDYLNNTLNTTNVFSPAYTLSARVGT